MALKVSEGLVGASEVSEGVVVASEVSESGGVEWVGTK